MDEVKNPELTAVDEETESVDEIEAPADKENNEIEIQVGGDSDESHDSKETAEDKKEPKIEKSLLTGIIIFAAAIVLFGGFFLISKTDWFRNNFDDTIIGTWTYRTTASEDELFEQYGQTRSYISFKDEKDANGENIAEVVQGTMKFTGIWNYIDDDSKKSESKTDRVFLYVPVDAQNSINIYYTYSVENGANERVLSLTNENSTSGEQITDQYVSASPASLEVNKIDSFKPSEGITGSWSSSPEDGMDITYSFNEDGTISMVHSFSTGSTSFSGRYKIDKDKDSTKKKETGVITCYYFADDKNTPAEYMVSYIIENKTKGSKLVLNGIEYDKK